MTRRFTDQEDAAIITGFADGHGAAHIGRALGRPVQAISDRAKLLHCWVSPIDEDGWRQDGIASLRRLWTLRDGHGRYTYSVVNVASKTKRSVNQVVAKAAKIGLEPRNAPPQPQPGEFPSWYENWARRAKAAPERAVERPSPLYYGHPIAVEALNAVFDQSRFAE